MATGPGRLREAERFGSLPPVLGVHFVSDNVYCPRAALLSLASGDDSGDEEPNLGPKLDWCGDYDEHQFAEALRLQYSSLSFWLMLLGPALFLVGLMWWLFGMPAGMLALLSVAVLLVKLWDMCGEILSLVRVRTLSRNAQEIEIDMAPTEITPVNWWTLRKSGFDCLRPEKMHDPDARLTGRPWRLLVQGRHIRIPVVKKHRGRAVCRPQHIVRLAAYCHLIEACEGGQAPFGILLFADSYDGLIIPFTQGHRVQFERAMQKAREDLAVYQLGRFVPDRPQREACDGCRWGKPRVHRFGHETVLDGKSIAPRLTKGVNGRLYHSPCGDRFAWDPPHRKAVQLGIAHE